MSILKLMLLHSAASLLLFAPADGDGAPGGDGKDGKEGEDKATTSMLDADKIKAMGQGDNKPADDAAKPPIDPNKKPDDQKPVDQPGQKETRPEWLKADKFWDAEKGAVRTEEMMKAYSDLEKKFTNGDHKAPAKPEDYKINLNGDQLKTLFGDEKFDATKDPSMNELTKWGVENKIPQGAMDQLLEKYVEIVRPEVEKLHIDIAAEKKQLGPNADAVIQNQFDFLGHMFRSGAINEAQLNEAQILMETAAGVKLLQSIRTYYGEQPIPTTPGNEDAGMPSADELRNMRADPKYDTDAAHRAKVDKLYDQRYGTAPAMSSVRSS